MRKHSSSNTRKENHLKLRVRDKCTELVETDSECLGVIRAAISFAQAPVDLTQIEVLDGMSAVSPVHKAGGKYNPQALVSLEGGGRATTP